MDLKTVIVLAIALLTSTGFAAVNRPGFTGGSNSCEDGAMTSKTMNKFSPEVRARAVRMVLDHAGEHPSRWAAVTSIAAKIGCTPQTLHDWVKKAEIDSGQRAGVPTDMAEKMIIVGRMGSSRFARSCRSPPRPTTPMWPSGAIRPSCRRAPGRTPR